LGFRYRNGPVSLEAFAFRNEIHDGIGIQATGDTVQGLPEYQNVNVDRLRYLGIEASGSAVLGAGFSTRADLTVFDSKDVRDPSNPVAQSYGLRVGGQLRYDHSSGRFWLAYALRHNGRQKDVAVLLSPVGSPLPAFTVQEARVGFRLFRTGRTEHSVVWVIRNLGNTLYSEASNSNFFRPAPGRSVVVSYRMDF
ncbi:MAG TPA: TonB-dependent receptor, partial [Gemmatimonadales bacterium]|nr:TonB-dependent receptor [Gemmatimonadales bacterium]